ncbi:AlpA family transcriptional regulator [Erythrobacter litoralis]|uniref:helix-turn-helix transcriptional regulator n=1 Tax=Erythrobacter litoralis TaxID=39960 RepID=UPI00243572D4|nr:AlpA family transcriptional regulator [Erythrobacter litoralis]MDG6079783.1 AlpA family transcriptional regulator [Erythrobacter litoralis]
MSDRFLRRPAVEEETGLSRSAIYRMMLEGEFPRPIRIGKQAVAWRQSAIEQWKSSRPVAGD